MYQKKKYQPIGPAFKKEDWENLKKGGKLAGKNIKKLSLKAKDFYRTQKDTTSFNKLKKAEADRDKVQKQLILEQIKADNLREIKKVKGQKKDFEKAYKRQKIQNIYEKMKLKNKNAKIKDAIKQYNKPSGWLSKFRR